jgi:hypothetical protein
VVRTVSALVRRWVSALFDWFEEKWSGRVDLNHRPPGPEPGALARLRYAPNRTMLNSLLGFVRNGNPASIDVSIVEPPFTDSPGGLIAIWFRWIILGAWFDDSLASATHLNKLGRA